MGREEERQERGEGRGLEQEWEGDRARKHMLTWETCQVNKVSSIPSTQATDRKPTMGRGTHIKTTSDKSLALPLLKGHLPRAQLCINKSPPQVLSTT